MIKKQTVWLLTMLSLMIVLSVYYMMSDSEELAFIDPNNEQLNEVDKEEGLEEGTEVENISTLGNSELFATIRMELEDKRSIKKDRLTEVVASSSATTNEINEALNEIDEIEKVESKEKILQESILAQNKNYEDVLVRAEDSIVHVHVIAEDLPRNEVVQIMQLVRDEIGDVEVDVIYQ